MTLIKILLGLLGLSIVVVVHEAGHFIAARRSGIKVEAFSIGWGKVLFSKKFGETDFRISLFPLGGYCKMQGEQAMIQAWESKARTIDTDEGDMYAAAWWKRIIVSLSGPVMNLIMATLIFFIISFIGYQIHYYPSRIVMASEYSSRQDFPADRAGLKSGDIVKAVNGSGIDRFDQLQQALMVSPEKTIDLTIERDGRMLTIPVTPELNKESGAGTLGIFPWIDAVVRSVSEDSVFHAAGLQPGDRIVEADGTAVVHALDISRLAGGETPVSTIKVIRAGSPINLSVPSAEGMNPGGLQFEYLSMRTPSFRLFYSLKEGFTESLDTVVNSVKGLGMLFRGIDLQSAVSGPLRITYMTGDLAFSGFSAGIAEGFLNFFRFIALINVALFIMNLLPIPVLDGGQIILFIVEGITRRKPNPSVLYRYQMLGTMIVFALIIFATTNDILFFSRN